MGSPWNLHLIHSSQPLGFTKLLETGVYASVTEIAEARSGCSARLCALPVQLQLHFELY